MNNSATARALAEALDSSIRVAWRALCRSRRLYRAAVNGDDGASWRAYYERRKREDRAVLLALLEVRREARAAGR